MHKIFISIFNSLTALQQQTNSSANQQQQQSASAQGQVTSGGSRNAGAGSGVVTATITPVSGSHQVWSLTLLHYFLEISEAMLFYLAGEQTRKT